MGPFLGSLIGSVLIGGLSTILGGTKSKSTTTTPTTTDPFYALMSPYAIGQIVNRMGALQGAGFPAGAMNTAGGNYIGQDIWKQILAAWPQITKGLGANLASASKPSGHVPRAELINQA